MYIQKLSWEGLYNPETVGWDDVVEYHPEPSQTTSETPYTLHTHIDMKNINLRVTGEQNLMLQTIIGKDNYLPQDVQKLFDNYLKESFKSSRR